MSVTSKACAVDSLKFNSSPEKNDLKEKHEHSNDGLTGSRLLLIIQLQISRRPRLFAFFICF